jgi:hypothetical protein
MTLKTALLVACMPLILLNCNACIEVQQQPDTLNSTIYKGKSEKDLISYINKRTVRVVVKCKIINNKTGALYKDYYSAGHGSGSILHSQDSFSLILTAGHVVKTDNISQGDLTRICDRFTIERYDLDGKLYDSHSDTPYVIAYSKKADLGVLRVEKNYGVSSVIADRTRLGERVLYQGFPTLGYSKAYLSIGKGYVGTIGIDGSITGMTRWVMFVYYGSSGSCIFNEFGQITGNVSAMSGFRPLMSPFIPHHGRAWGPNAETIRTFLRNNKLGFLLQVK